VGAISRSIASHVGLIREVAQPSCAIPDASLRVGLPTLTVSSGPGAGAEQWLIESGVLRSVLDGFVKRVELIPAAGERRVGHPWDLPAVAQLTHGLELHPKVTYLIGENGSGKSTLLTAIAMAAGMNAEGGSSNYAFPTEGPEAHVYAFSQRPSHTRFAESIRLVRRGRRPKTDFFLRAESLFVAATYLEQLDDNPLLGYGRKSLHEQSHGEGFLAVMIHRFGADGFYLLDEPEAALSTQNCLTCLRRIHELVQQGSQFVISTHSPIILAYPDAAIYRCTDSGLEPTDYEDAEPVRLTTSFLSSRERFLQRLLGD
jgi:predicted ATPase